jgi:hypothetical protein
MTTIEVMPRCRVSTILWAIAVCLASTTAFGYGSPEEPEILRYQEVEFTTPTIATFETPGWGDECMTACIKETLCRAYTFRLETKACSLHRSAADGKQTRNTMSGMVFRGAPDELPLTPMQMPIGSPAEGQK